MEKLLHTIYMCVILLFFSIFKKISEKKNNSEIDIMSVKYFEDGKK